MALTVLNVIFDYKCEWFAVFLLTQIYIIKLIKTNVVWLIYPPHRNHFVCMCMLHFHHALCGNWGQNICKACWKYSPVCHWQQVLGRSNFRQNYRFFLGPMINSWTWTNIYVSYCVIPSKVFTRVTCHFDKVHVDFRATLMNGCCKYGSLCLVFSMYSMFNICSFW